MNIAFFLVPKLRVLWLSAGASVREALSLMLRHGKAEVPVLDADSHIAGTVSARELTRYLRETGHEADTPLGATTLVRPADAVGIDAQVEDLLPRTVDHSFVPVVDDRRVFIGVVPRRAILRHLMPRPA